MSVKRWGSGEDSALLLHCTLAKGGAWGPVARHLKGALTMTAPDLLAHGEASDHDPAQDFHDQATQEAARHLPEVPTHLIGHSFGATVALRLALDHPARVKTLTLIEPVLFCAASGPGRAAHDAHVAAMPDALRKGDAAAAARIFLSLWGAAPFDTLPPAQQRDITDRIWIPDACEAALVHDRAGLLPRLPDLHMPTLLLQGSASPPVIAEVISCLAGALTNARVQTIPGAAHMAPLTHAPETAQAIADLLTRA